VVEQHPGVYHEFSMNKQDVRNEDMKKKGMKKKDMKN